MTGTAMRTVAGIILTVGVASLPYAQEHPQSKYARIAHIPNGFLKAREFLDLPAQMREGYAMGFVNGITVSPFFRADEQEIDMFNTCAGRMDSGQIAEIILKYVRNNPEQWHEPLNGLSWNALMATCPDLKAKIMKE